MSRDNRRETFTESDEAAENINPEQTTGRKQGDADKDDPLGGEHTAKAPELGSNSLADKKPKGKVQSSGGGM